MINRKEKLLEFLQANPEDSFLRFGLAKEYEKEEQWNKAIEIYEKILETDVNYFGAYYHLGKAYEEIESYSKAIEVYTKGKEICQKLNEQHAFKELHSAHYNLELEMD